MRFLPPLLLFLTSPLGALDQKAAADPFRIIPDGLPAFDRLPEG